MRSITEPNQTLNSLVASDTCALQAKTFVHSLGLLQHFETLVCLVLELGCDVPKMI